MTAQAIVEKITEVIIAGFDDQRGGMQYASRIDGKPWLKLDGEFTIDTIAQAAYACIRQELMALPLSDELYANISRKCAQAEARGDCVVQVKGLPEEDIYTIVMQQFLATALPEVE